MLNGKLTVGKRPRCGEIWMCNIANNFKDEQEKITRSCRTMELSKVWVKGSEHHACGTDYDCLN